MKPLGKYELIRQWIAYTAVTLSASTFWGAIVAGIARVSFDVEPGPALLFIGLPAALIIAAFLLPRMRSILRYD
jgi:hypothetical protein